MQFLIGIFLKCFIHVTLFLKYTEHNGVISYLVLFPEYIIVPFGTLQILRRKYRILFIYS